MRKHEDAFVSLPIVHDLSHNLPSTVFQLLAAPHRLLIRLFRDYSQSSCDPNYR